MKRWAFKVTVIESESGWGQRIDDHMVCLSIEDAKNFIQEFNSENDLPNIPDWYMYAEDTPIHIELNDNQYNKLKSNKRMWLSSLKKYI